MLKIINDRSLLEKFRLIDCYCINTIYLHYYQKLIIPVSKLDLNDRLCFHKKFNIPYKALVKDSFAVNKSAFFLTLFFSFFLATTFCLLLFLYTLFVPKNHKTGTIMFANCKASEKVLKKYKTYHELQDICLVTNPIVYNSSKLVNIFSMLHPLDIISNMHFLWGDLCLRIYNLSRFFNKLPILDFVVLYLKETQTIIYTYINNLFFQSNAKTIPQIISGSTIERYATSLMASARKYNIKTVCVPHGGCYDIELPSGIFGDKYYSLSLNEGNCIEKYYDTEVVHDEAQSKFIYSSNAKPSGSHKIVYFTDGRAAEKNQLIIDHLSTLIDVFFIKLHPSDLLDSFNIPDNSNVVTDYDFAVVNSTGISRSSTVLLDLKYSESSAIHVCLDEEDENISKVFYPWLQVDGIISISSLYEIKRYIS